MSTDKRRHDKDRAKCHCQRPDKDIDDMTDKAQSETKERNNDRQEMSIDSLYNINAIYVLLLIV